MFKFILRRLLQTIPVIIGVTILTFLMMHLIPGNPAQIMAGESASIEQIALMEERLGLNDPLPVQYFNYIKGVVTGDLGNSIRSGRPVLGEILLRLRPTIELAIYSTILSILIGLIAGIISAVRRYSWLDSFIMIFALFGLSMPAFWLGLMLIQYLAIGINIGSINTGWFAASGWGTWQQQI